MTLTLNVSDWEELCEQASVADLGDLLLDEFEEAVAVPERLGRGYSCSAELSPGVWLSFVEREFDQDWMLEVPTHDHPIEMGVFLSGFICFDAVHPNLGGNRGYFSGSGVSPAYVEKHRGGEPFKCVSVEILPAVLESWLDEQTPDDLRKQLFKGEEWKVSFYPTVAPAIRSIAQQIWSAPYRGSLQRMYLQGKVFELLATQLDWIGLEQEKRSPKTTIDCVYEARDILLASLENPPSVMELGQRVGVSSHTLQRRFRALFGKTVFDYVTDRRMELAEQLLRQKTCTVAEVAAIVGYSNSAHFAAAFKRRYGMTPSECILGRKPLSR